MEIKIIDLEFIPVNKKIEKINDPKIIDEKRKEKENEVIRYINRFMMSTSQKKSFLLRNPDRPYNPTREFFEEIKNKLEPEGYICFFDNGKYRTWFKITLPPNEVKISLENNHEKRNLILVPFENSSQKIFREEINLSEDDNSSTSS